MVFLTSLLEAVTERSRRLMGNQVPLQSGPASPSSLLQQAEQLLSVRGEASGLSLARSLLDLFRQAPEPVRLAFLKQLVAQFGPSDTKLKAAVVAFQNNAEGAADNLHAASEPRRQELIRRLNQAPGGIRDLVAMRESVLSNLRGNGDLKRLDNDFRHLFASWFNRGFLVLQAINWDTPASILEKIIRYEAVHAIRDWDDLRLRLQPKDRRCFAFFHPRLPDEPLIFVEVAVTREIPPAIAPLLDPDREEVDPRDATTAVFYSISNCQRGLAGISFGNFLIKQVVEELKAQLPGLSTFVTLSPVPGFAAWVQHELRTENSCFLSASDKRILQDLQPLDVLANRHLDGAAKDLLLNLGARYFLEARGADTRPVDPVARFHLGNGARLERINWMGDTSAKGMKQGAGLMVNYLYDLPTIVDNHESFTNSGAVHASPRVRKLIRANEPQQKTTKLLERRR